MPACVWTWVEGGSSRAPGLAIPPLSYRPFSAQALVRATPASQPGFDPTPLVAVAAREASSADKATRR